MGRSFTVSGKTFQLIMLKLGMHRNVGLILFLFLYISYLRNILVFGRKRKRQKIWAENICSLSSSIFCNFSSSSASEDAQLRSDSGRANKSASRVFGFGPEFIFQCIPSWNSKGCMHQSHQTIAAVFKGCAGVSGILKDCLYFSCLVLKAPNSPTFNMDGSDRLKG